MPHALSSLIKNALCACLAFGSVVSVPAEEKAASDVEYEDVDLILEVRPLINSKNEITIEVGQQNNTVPRSTFIKIGNILTQSLNGKIAVPDGAMVSATGTWTWSTPGREGGEERKFSATLVQDGEKLTGKLKSPGRDGASTETEIAEGSVKSGEISFNVSREWNGNKRTSTYTGKLTDEAITGKIASKDREGKDQSQDWTAKREAAK